MSAGHPAHSHVEPTASDPDRFASEPGETGPHPGDAAATAPRHYRGCTDHPKTATRFWVSTLRCAYHHRVQTPNHRKHRDGLPDPDPKGLRERDSRSRRKCQASSLTRPLGVECRCRPRAAGFLVVSGRGSIAWPSLVSRVFRKVFVFAPSAPAIQVFIPTMGAFDRRQLIVELGHGHLASCRWGCNGNDNSA